MNLNSLQTRITLTIAGIVAISLTLTIIFFSSRATNELSSAMDENAINLLNATFNLVSSQHSNIQFYKEAMMARRKEELKNNTDIVYKLIESAYMGYKAAGVAEEEAKRRILSRINQIRFADDVGYFWVNDITRPIPKIIMHPVRPDLIGKSSDGPRYHCLINGEGNIFTAFLNIAEQDGEGYVEYLWPKPSPSGLTVDQPKIGFVKYFKPWNWIIGTGVYVDDIEIDVKKRTEAVIRDLNNTILKQMVGENGYYFIFDKNNFVLAHPLYAGMDGKNFINPVTKNNILDELKDSYHRKLDFFQYRWDKPEDKGNFIYAKKSYVTYFEPLGWYIASSVYDKYYENKISGAVKQIVLFSLFFIIGSILVAYLVSKSISKPLILLIKSISNTDDYGIPLNKVKRIGATEIQTLSTTFNKMITSITESRDKLEASESFNKVLFHDSIIPLVVMDQNTGKFIDCNQAAADIYGFKTIADTIGKSPLDVSAERQEDGELSSIAAPRHIAEALKKGSVLFDWLHQKVNGELWNAEVQLMSLTYKDQNLLQFSLLDITARKQAQEQLSHNRKMDAIGQLAGGVAHDFNNLLAGIITASQMLKLPKRKLDDKGLELVDMIMSASTRAADFTNKLLTFGRKGKMLFSPINIHTAINETIAMLSNTIDKKINIRVNNNATNFIVNGDNAELQNIFLNLGINASHAMAEGGELTFSTTNIELNREFCDASTFAIEPGQFIDIEVRDTGCGIEDNCLSKIFDPFYTTKQPGSGSGLGLSAVYGTVHSHNGTINVASEIGIGTVFHIYLPNTSAPETTNEETSDNNITITGSGTILLVDDEELIRKVGSILLKEMGFDVILAANGLEAVNIFSSQNKDIDLIITDMIMPVMNGREAFYRFKKIDNYCKIIISSGFVRDENLEQMERDGLSGFIKKPFKSNELSQLIGKVLGLTQ